MADAPAIDEMIGKPQREPSSRWARVSDARRWVRDAVPLRDPAAAFDGGADTMNDAEIQKLWLNEYQRLEEDAERSRDSMSVPLALVKIYDKLSDREKQQIEPVLAEWLMSDDSKNRYDARFIARNRNIRSLRAAVEKAIARLVGQPGPGVRFEVELLESLVREWS